MSKTNRSATASAAPADNGEGKAYSSGGNSSAGESNKPAHTIRYRNLKATIWKNASQNGEFYSVTLSRSYQDKDDQWHEATSFNTNDLPTIAKLCNDAHSWIAWQERRAREEADKAGGTASGGRR
jgi:hypothetical protein